MDEDAEAGAPETSGRGTGEKQSKQGVAYNFLLTAIISGRYQPEQPLVEREICDRVGVSRTPVREALRRLGSEGLVDFRPNRGVFVAELTQEKARQLYELKEAVECMAARLCALRATEEDFGRMEANIDQQRRYVSRDELMAAVDTDMRFHVLLVETARSPLIEQQARSMILQTRRISQLGVYDPENTWRFIDQHTEILEAVRSRDGDAASEAVRRHVGFIEQFQQERWGMLF